MPALIHNPDHTDLAGWRLQIGEDSHGQQKWVYLPEGPARDAWPQNKVDRYWIGLNIDAKNLPEPKKPMDAARNGLKFYKELQSEDGHFATEYSGPLFLLPGLVIAMHVTGQSFRPEQVIEMRRYLLNIRRKEGGWGLHTESPPTALGTVMNYVALRLLGMGPDEGPMTEIRALIHRMGGATSTPSWGKCGLSILGVYDWEGLNPIPPELWLLPEWLPIAPWRFWIHVRQTFAPMSYLYGTRFVGPMTPIVFALRNELYTQPYESIRWAEHRNNINPIDLYCPIHPFRQGLNGIVSLYEKLPWMPVLSTYLPLRKVANDAAYAQVTYEDENTGYQTIGPVGKSYSMMCRFAREGPDSHAFKAHLSRVDDFLWLGKHGMMMTGTNGTQLWDVGFLGQAMVETGLAGEEENTECALGMLDWLDKAQMREDPKWYVEGYRHRTKGAWSFSTPEQSYTVSDCASEGLKAAIALQSLPYTPKPISLDRMRDCVDTVLSMQNPNGGFASYELQRGSEKLEWLNAAEVFGRIMIDYTYTECTTSVLSALKHFSTLDRSHRSEDIARTVRRAIEFIHREQRPDGSWYGSWGVCFTYATMFALESLAIAGETHANSERVRRACKFLIDHQMADGGWGETYMSCLTLKYVHHERSQVVMTSWAILALIYAEFPDKSVVERATRVIMDRQRKDGRWEQEGPEGIFNQSCAIYNPSYKFIFTIWALGRADKYLAA